MGSLFEIPGSINKNYVAYVYNSNVSRSLEVANYYQQKRGIPVENIISVSLPAPESGSCEIPISKTEYEDSIETPLKNLFGIEGTDIPSGAGNNFVIILGYGTPLSFVDDNGEIIAIASRLHRLGKPHQQKRPNHTYDRRGDWHFFDGNDATELFITAVLDGPTPEAVMKLIDRSIDVSNQQFITGKIYVDPYGNPRVTENQLQYEQDMLDFVNTEIPNLGLTSVVTADPEDPYTESTIAYLKNDSFYWGWGVSTFSKNLFLNQNERRVFLYNADDDSACQIHYYQDGSPFDPNGSDPWCNLAINVEPGYATTAGAVTAPSSYNASPVGEDAYLRPRPFFEALHRGATLGEAFLFASPYVNWKIILIGDPLMTVNFLSDLPADQDITLNTVSNNRAIINIKEILEESLAYGAREARLHTDLLNTVAASQDFGEELYLLYALAKWRDLKTLQSFYDLYHHAVRTWVSHIEKTTGLKLDAWLTRENEKVSEYLSDVLAGIYVISDSYVYPEESWVYDFVYTHDRLTHENIHFRLQVASDEDFSTVVIDEKTSDSTSGWRYEQEQNVFVQFPTTGFPSNFGGRRIRYIALSINYLTRTELYYVRWLDINASGNPLGIYRTDTEPMIIKR